MFPVWVCTGVGLIRTWDTWNLRPKCLREAGPGGCSERPVKLRLRELWQQASNHPGQDTKSEIFGLGEASGIGTWVQRLK